MLSLVATLNAGVPKYQYTVDLENIVQDRVYVELLTPEIKRNTIRFYIPKVVPGTYQIADFGRFIRDFTATDKEGNVLHAERTDINTFVIHDARDLHKISYWVDDTFDNSIGSSVYGMSGTNIEEGRGIVFNAHGFLGYFEDMKEMQFEMTIKKETNHFGATAMPATYPDMTTEVYQADSYNYLVDMPILFGKPDTTTVHVGETQVLIAVNSPSGRATSNYMAKHLADVLRAESDYMGGKLPVNKYAFLMHFLTPGQQVRTGALEHNYSSLYVLPDFPQEQFIQPIKDIAAHEFFHIVAPLNVHSEQIRYFDFNDPEMSQHLWMYEGVTEYFSHHAQLVHGITDMNYFLTQMQNKIEDALNSYNDALPFTELSKDCLTKHSAEYGNVYQKGALIGLCLDVILRKESAGEMGLMDLMLDLMQKFGKDQPFKDRRLFNEIKKLSYPEVGRFLKKYVDGKETLPLKEIFNSIGVDYTAPGTTRQFTYGNIAFGYHQEANRIVVTSLSEVNAFGKKMGYRVGDEISTINGKRFDPANPALLFEEEQANFVEGQKLVLEVVRKDDQGQEETIILSAPIEKVDVPSAPTLKPMPVLNEQQKAMQAQWQQGAKKPGVRS
jgi:predicted metalloprotease with PDZ domain